MPIEVRLGCAEPMMTSIGLPWVDFGPGWPTPAKPASATKRRGRVAQLAERLSDTEEEAGSIPAPPIKRGRVAQKGRALVLQTGGSWIRFQPRPLAWS